MDVCPQTNYNPSNIPQRPRKKCLQRAHSLLHGMFSLEQSLVQLHAHYSHTTLSHHE